MSNVNVPIPLGGVKIEITVRDQPVRTVAQACLRLLPKPSLVFECEVQDKPTGLGFQPDEISTLLLLDHGIHLDVHCYCLPSPGRKEGILRVAFTPKTEPCTVVEQEGQRLQTVTFDVLNFPKFEIDDTAELVADGWRIEITAVPDLKEVVDELNEKGGYGVTHHGTLKRSDGETFSIEDADNAMDCLRQFLSFARGVHCAPVLPVGFNSDGEVVWKQWGSPPVEPWGWTPSWFDTHCSETLAEVFPGFWNCLNGSDYDYVTRTRIALDWYLRSNRNNGDMAGGVILSQAGLERLADAHSFKGAAAKCIRKLVNTYSIPSELPDGLDTLNEVLCAVRKNADKNGDKDKIFDGPEALVAVRNDLMHPKPYLAGISLSADCEAWNLGQWYLEMILLSMFDFKGKYANRLIEGRVEGQLDTVPWAATSD